MHAVCFVQMCGSCREQWAHPEGILCDGCLQVRPCLVREAPTGQVAKDSDSLEFLVRTAEPPLPAHTHPRRISLELTQL